MRKRLLLIALIVIASVGIVPGSVSADDEWPDRCADAPIVEPNGDYTITMNTPQDQDYMRVRATQGDYIHFSLITPEEQNSLVVMYDGHSSRDISLTDGKNLRTGIRADEPAVEDIEPKTGASWKMWPEEDGTSIYCMFLADFNGDVPYQFTLKMRLNSPDPATFESAVSESEFEQKNQRISELESELEQKNQQISELESRVEEFESQSSNGSTQNVTIQVTVNPANEQNFIEGGEAVVQAESENADVSEIQVEYGAGTYQLNSSGEAAIPLANTGTRELTVIHENTTETVSIDVQSQEQQNQQDTTTNDDIPGFGAVATVIALLTGASLLQRYW